MLVLIHLSVLVSIIKMSEFPSFPSFPSSLQPAAESSVDTKEPEKLFTTSKRKVNHIHSQCSYQKKSRTHTFDSEEGEIRHKRVF